MDALDRLTAALHAELCRLHDVTPEGWSLTGDYAALRDDARQLAEVALTVVRTEAAEEWHSAPRLSWDNSPEV